MSWPYGTAYAAESCNNDHGDSDGLKAQHVDGELDHWLCKRCGWRSPSVQNFHKSDAQLGKELVASWIDKLFP